LALYWLFSSSVGVKIGQSSSNGKQEPVPEDIYQIVLTNKKQGNLN
jgi:hypothetical protein